MFKLRFFGSLQGQRDAFLSADTFTPIPLHPTVQAQLDELATTGGVLPDRLSGPIGLFAYVLKRVRGLVTEILAWNTLAALVVLGAVIVTRELVTDTSSLAYSFFLAAAYLILKILHASLEYTNNTRRLQVHRGVQAALYALVNNKLLRIDPRSQSAVNKGHLKTLVSSDVESIEDFISAALHQWAPALVSVVVLAPALCIVSGWVGLAALLAALLLIPVATVGATVVEHYQKKVQASQDSLTTLVGEWVKNIRLVRFLGWTSAVRQDVIVRMRKTIRLGAIRHAVVVVVYAVSFSWSMVPLLAIFLLSSAAPIPLNLPQIFSTFWILDHLLSQIQYIPHSLSLYGSATAGARRVLELLRAPDLERHLISTNSQHKSDLGCPRKIVLQNISLNFDGVTALNSISLSFDLAQRTAIIGEVGSGKSSLLSLLIGDLHPSTGEIHVVFDTKNGPTTLPLWREDAYTALRSSVAFSPQQPFLSNSSMRLNIDLAGDRAIEDIEVAALASQLKPDILLLPRLYEEEIGESGINLSGGQRQRVSLARAFISKRELLVLDDPLSAVDTSTAEGLMDAIINHSHGLVLASHRLREVMRCDRVVVLKQGRVIEDGEPNALSLSSDSQFTRFLSAMEDHDR